MVQLQERTVQAPVNQLRIHYGAGTRISLPPDFTVQYQKVGSISLDNLLIENVLSAAIQDKHPMWIEPKMPCYATYADIKANPDGLVFGRVILDPDDPNSTLEAVITGIRKIPEIEALHSPRRVQMYSPEIVNISLSDGRKVSYRDIDFVHCYATRLGISLEVPLRIPKRISEAGL